MANKVLNLKFLTTKLQYVYCDMVYVSTGCMGKMFTILTLHKI